MPVYSYSKLSTYASCPLKYRFRYVERRKPDVGPTIEAYLGQRVHETLEWLHDLVRHHKPPSLEDILAQYEQRWAAAWRDDVRIVKQGVDAASYRAIGEEALRKYDRRHRPFDQGIVLGLEKRFRLRLDAEHTLSGIIDRLTLISDGVLEVHDYKTSGTLPSLEDASADRQAGVYDLAAHHLFPDAHVVRLVWHYLRFDQRLVTERTPLEREALVAELLGDMRRIEEATDYPPHESALCHWCEFCSVCPAKVHRHKLDTLDAGQRQAEPGVVLVDRLVRLRAALRAQRRDLETEIEEAEGQLAAYAAEEGLTTVLGSEFEATIDRQPRLSFPAKGDPQREALEKAVRKEGLWERVADLGVVQLRALLEDGGIAEDAAAHLRDFATVEPHISVRLRRRTSRPAPE